MEAGLEVMMEGTGMEKGQVRAIGIDLGTSYCCVGVWQPQHNMAEIIVNEQGNRTTPSMVAFTASQRLIGDAAKNQIATNPLNTVFDAKRLIGRRFSDPCVQQDIILWPFVIEEVNDKPLIQVTYKGETKLFAPEEISAMLLMKMKTISESYLKCEVKNAFITVPAYFNDAQKRATKDASVIAGLNVMRIINEPTAAAITYGFHDVFTGERSVLVFDLGGGTFDVSVLSVQKGLIAVKAVRGDMHLGGQDFDNRMLNFCVQKFNTKYKLDMSRSAKALRRLRSECERAKRSLSSEIETVIDIDCLYERHDFFIKFRRAKFEELNTDLFQKCIEIVRECLQDAQMTNDQIDDIVLVGGSSRIPKLQELLRQNFGQKKLCNKVNPDEAVAYGAAVQAAALNNEDVTLKLTDVTPLSLGTEIKGGVMTAIVLRNTPIPTQREKYFTTACDNQTKTSIPIYEGERPLAAQNNLLGEFKLSGIPQARSGVPKIKICFKISEDGILTASAEDEVSGANEEITITNAGGRLNREEIDKMIADAEKFKEDDKKVEKKNLARKSLEYYIYNMRSRVTKAKIKQHIKASDAEDILSKLNSAQEWLDDNEEAEASEFEKELKELQIDRLPPFTRNL
ncbi:heat shock cognate 70 kDa protein [Cryptomeria japonica]|uniref:heat shock cognate 70 kDa protein n=1 Tax=Cryptomeria japonica TaxID=3369 RepID=UPI0025AD9251|nr:heat shock cognate 70 kDa protein [Cryptomeria japonica]XP_057818611.1 heat shock cognate 70 kDa protein [Cryptomeria japonica]